MQLLGKVPRRKKARRLATLRPMNDHPSAPRANSLEKVDGTKMLRVKKRRQIIQSRAESQQIAV
jgi:hypothetical protein